MVNKLQGNSKCLTIWYNKWFSLKWADFFFHWLEFSETQMLLLVSSEKTQYFMSFYLQSQCPQNVPKIIRHFKNLATNVARFVKCVWPFGDISHWRVKSYNFIIFKSEIDDFMKANYLCCIEIIFKKLISYPKDRNWRFERRISGYNLNSDNYEKIKVSCQTFTI